jgi:outer membrane protein assembly factor BamB
LLLFASSGSIGAPIAGDESVEHLPPPGKLKAVGQKLEHGGIAALDATTGAAIWRFDTTPHAVKTIKSNYSVRAFP